MLSDERLKQITKGGRQSLFWSRKIAIEQELQTKQQTTKEVLELISRLSPVCAIMSPMNSPMIVPLKETHTYKALKDYSEDVE